MSTMVQRSDKVAFFGVNGGFTRMTGFTSLSTSKNAKEYARQYVDQAFEDSDVIGYSPSIEYAFDQYTGNAVHADIVGISDSELVGSSAVREIIVVDKTVAGVVNGSFVARKRSFSVIPDADGDGTDSYAYSGSFKTKSAVVLGEATTTDNWQTITFTPSTGAEYLVTFNISALSGQIPNATILVNGTLLTTDANGLAEIELPARTYPYTVTKTLYTTVNSSITVTNAAVYKAQTIVLA